MKTEPQYICDVEGCGKKKGEINHWYAVERLVANCVVHRWHEDPLKIPNLQHACGQEHALQLVSKWMGSNQ
jgi:hypothetical protein